MAGVLQKIIVQTGNIIDMEDQIRLVGQSTSDELKGCVKSALSEWRADGSDPQQDAPGAAIVVQGARKPLMYSASRGISTTAKVFVSDNSGEHITDAINTVMRNVGRECIECVIVAPPDVSDDVSLQDVMETWLAMERAVDDGLVNHLGIADVPSRLFKELYEWARVKPSTIQVNLDNCCNVSDELTDYARTHDVQVLTHSDNPDMLDEDVVSTILSRVGAPEADCRVLWLARHRTIHTCFGLILDKGYTIAIDAATSQED